MNFVYSGQIIALTQYFHARHSLATSCAMIGIGIGMFTLVRMLWGDKGRWSAKHPLLKKNFYERGELKVYVLTIIIIYTIFVYILDSHFGNDHIGVRMAYFVYFLRCAFASNLRVRLAGVSDQAEPERQSRRHVHHGRTLPRRFVYSLTVKFQEVPPAPQRSKWGPKQVLTNPSSSHLWAWRVNELIAKCGNSSRARMAKGLFHYHCNAGAFFKFIRLHSKDEAICC